MFKSILIPVDSSPCSDKALTEGAKLAKTLGANIVILSVIQTPAVLYGMGDAVAYQDQLYGSLRKKVEGVLAKAKKVVRQAGVKVQTLLFEGTHPADVILQEHLHHDLIVMGAHGHKGVNRWFVSSVAEGVLRRAQKPCFIVHSEKNSEEK